MEHWAGEADLRRPVGVALCHIPSVRKNMRASCCDIIRVALFAAAEAQPPGELERCSHITRAAVTRGLRRQHAAHLAEGKSHAEHASLLRDTATTSSASEWGPPQLHPLQQRACAAGAVRVISVTQGVSAGPKMLAAHTNMSESLEGDAEQPSCCTGNLRRSARLIHPYLAHRRSCHGTLPSRMVAHACNH